MSKLIIRVLWILSLSSIEFTWSLSLNQTITLYRSYNCQGRSIPIGSKVSTMFEWNDAALSVTLTGAWLFYENMDYNQGITAAMEYVFVGKPTCHNFIYVDGKLSSIRYVGDRNNYMRNSMTIYKSKYFQEDEEYILDDRPIVNMKDHASLIITGISPWTLYDKPYFQGKSVCLFPETEGAYRPFFVYDVTKNIEVPYNTIRSVRLGCNDAKVANGTVSFVSASIGGFKGKGKPI